MKNVSVLVLLAVCLMLTSSNALAAITAGSSELGLHAGYISGGDITDDILGSRAKLKSSAVVGANYTYDFTSNWAAEGRYTWDIGKVKNSTNNPDMNVHFFDLNAVYHFMPESSLVPYLTAGVGWAVATGTDIAISTNTINDGNGLTCNAGGGLKFFMTDSIYLRGDARYRFIDRLVNSDSTDLNAIEVTGGVGFKF